MAASVTESIRELNDNILKKFVALELKVTGLQFLLDITHSSEGIDSVIESNVITVLFAFLHNPSEKLSSLASNILINIFAEERGASAFLKLESSTKKHYLDSILSEICNADSNLADALCLLLRNLSVHSTVVPGLVTLMEPLNESLSKLLAVFTNVQHNTHGHCLHDLAHVFGNLTTHPDVRRTILEKIFLEPLVTFISYEKSESRRAGVISAIKNCSFNVESHERLLGEEIDLLPSIVYPLMDGQEFDDDDSDKFPLMLQFLESTKTREGNDSIRKSLLEILLQLCITKQGREYIREKNIYVILREYHKWEKNREVLLACENVIDILIRTEEEMGAEDIRNVPQVPEDLVQKFQDMDASFVADS